MNQLKTHIVEANYHVNNPGSSNQRTEFKLPNNKNILSNLRLGNVGALRTGGADRLYATSVGLWSLVKQITLYAGKGKNQVVDWSSNPASWISFENSLRTNSKQLYLTNYYNKSRNCFREAAGTLFVEFAGNGFAITDDETTTAKGTLDLKECLKFLEQVKILPEGYSWRLVIEWNQDSSQFVAGNAEVVQILRPILLCDELVSNQPMKLEKTFNYYGIEQDSQYVEEVTAGVQKVNYKYSGFNNKVVRRMAMMNQPQAVYAHYMRQYCSQAVDGEQWNVILNGNQVFEFEGIDSPAKKQVLIHRLFGNQCFPLGLNFPAGLESDAIWDDGTVVDELKGAFSWGCFNVGNKVSTLQLKWQRDFANLPYLDQALRIQLFGEVLKNIQFLDNGQVEVSYVKI